MLSQLAAFLKGKKGILEFHSEEVLGMTSLFHDLPDYLILKIFSFIRIRERLYLRQVSKKWFRLLYDFSIWKTISLNEDVFISTCVNKEVLRKWICDFGRTIQRLDFGNTDWISDEEVTQVARACYNLRNISVKGCSKVSDVAILELAHNCPKLEKIDVFLTRVTSGGFEQLVRNCPNIKCAKLGSHGNTHRMLESLCTHSSRITQLSIHDVIPYSAANPTVDDSLISRMVSKFPGLERLNLIWCCFITDLSLMALSKGCPSLRGLKLRECQQISDSGLREILQNCVQLGHLSVERLYKVTDMLIQNDGCDILNLSNVRSLKMFDTKITDVGLQKIAELCPQLVELSFGEYSFHPKYIKGTCLAAIAQNCKKLKSLQVFCEEINNESLFAIGECLKDLTDLSIGDCRRCTVVGVLELAQNCRNLIRLSIKNCDSIGDKDLRQIRECLPYLKTIELPGNTRISPYGSQWFYITSSQTPISLPWR